MVSNLFKKAKKAARKLLRKLGIGKKKGKHGKEERSKQEMEADLKMAISSAEKFAKKDDSTDEKIKKNLIHLKKKYELKELKLVVDKTEVEEDIVHIHGKMNPDNDSNWFRRNKRKVYTQSSTFRGIEPNMPGRASEMKPLKKGSGTWFAAIKEVQNTISNQGQIQVKVESSSDTLSFIKAIFAKIGDTEDSPIRMNRYRAHTQSKRPTGVKKYPKGYEQHMAYEGGKLYNPHIKFYVGDSNGHIFYEVPN